MHDSCRPSGRRAPRPFARTGIPLSERDRLRLDVAFGILAAVVTGLLAGFWAAGVDLPRTPLPGAAVVYGNGLATVALLGAAVVRARLGRAAHGVVTGTVGLLAAVTGWTAFVLVAAIVDGEGGPAVPLLLAGLFTYRFVRARGRR